MDAEEFLERYAAGTRQFHKGNRQGIDLKGADLSEIDLFSANWNGADLSEATLIRAKLNSTSLSRASLTNANLSGIEGSSINLSWADLSDADLQQIAIKRATNKSNTGLCFMIYFCGGFDQKLL